MNIRQIIMSYVCMIQASVLLGLSSISREGYLKGLSSFWRDNKAMASTGASQVLVLLISVFICSVVGLYFTPQFATACTYASNAFNGSEFEPLLDIVYTMVLPILWAVLFIFLLVGSGAGVYRLAQRL